MGHRERVENSAHRDCQAVLFRQDQSVLGTNQQVQQEHLKQYLSVQSMAFELKEERVYRVQSLLLCTNGFVHQE